MYHSWLNGGGCLFLREPQYSCSMRVFCEALKKYNYEFISLDIPVYGLGYQYTNKVASILCVSNCISSISLCIGCSMVNVNGNCMQYDLYGDTFFGCVVT